MLQFWALAQTECVTVWVRAYAIRSCRQRRLLHDEAGDDDDDEGEHIFVSPVGTARFENMMQSCFVVIGPTRRAAERGNNFSTIDHCWNTCAEREKKRSVLVKERCRKKKEEDFACENYTQTNKHKTSHKYRSPNEKCEKQRQENRYIQHTAKR